MKYDPFVLFAAQGLKSRDDSSGQPWVGTVNTYPVAPTADSFYQFDRANISQYRLGDVLNFREIGLTGYSYSKAWQVLYRSENTFGVETATVTTIVLPVNVTQGNESVNVVSYQQAEDSSFLNCNPSYSVLTGGANPEFQAILDKGYVLNIPDHEGPNSSFVAGPLEGKLTLDSLRALKNAKAFTGVTPGTAILWGYSGGSIASGWAAEMYDWYAPELDIAAVAVGGLIANVTATVELVNGTPLVGFVPPGLWGLIAEYPEFATVMAQEIKPEYTKMIADAQSQCVFNDIIEYQGLNVYDFVQSGTGFFNVPTVQTTLNNNTLGSHTPKMPLIVYNGIEDQIAPIGQVDRVVSQYCSNGGAVMYLRGSHMDHASAAGNYDGQVFSAFADIFAGDVWNSCSVVGPPIGDYADNNVPQPRTFASPSTSAAVSTTIPVSSAPMTSSAGTTYSSDNGFTTTSAPTPQASSASGEVSTLIVGPTSAVPSTETETTSQATGTLSAEPSVETGTTSPVAGTTSAEPSVETGPTSPVTGTTSTEPSAETETTLPSTGTGASPPATETSIVEPTAGAGTSSYTTEILTAKPSAETLTSSPAVETTSELGGETGVSSEAHTTGITMTSSSPEPPTETSGNPIDAITNLVSQLNNDFGAATDPAQLIGDFEALDSVLGTLIASVGGSIGAGDVSAAVASFGSLAGSLVQVLQTLTSRASILSRRSLFTRASADIGENIEGLASQISSYEVKQFANLPSNAPCDELVSLSSFANSLAAGFTSAAAAYHVVVVDLPEPPQCSGSYASESAGGSSSATMAESSVPSAAVSSVPASGVPSAGVPSTGALSTGASNTGVPSTATPMSRSQNSEGLNGVTSGSDTGRSGMGSSEVTRTTVVTALTTYCPEATTVCAGAKCHTVTEATTLTITDCPCTLTAVTTEYVTYCPQPTTFTHSGAVYTVESPGTITLSLSEGPETFMMSIASPKPTGTLGTSHQGAPKPLSNPGPASSSPTKAAAAVTQSKGSQGLNGAKPGKSSASTGPAQYSGAATAIAESNSALSVHAVPLMTLVAMLTLVMYF